MFNDQEVMDYKLANNMINYQEVLGYKFVNNKMDELVRNIHLRIAHDQKTFIVTANPEIITYAQSHPSYEKVIKGADWIIPDGAGIILASKILGTPLQERLAGFDLMDCLLQIADTNHYRAYFFGTKPQIISVTVKNIRKKYPNIQVVGYHHGYFDVAEEKAIVTELIQKKPNLVFVGLGFPKQEEWISKHLPLFDKGIFMGVGGSLNVWAGVDKRAPEMWRNLNLEWLYRLLVQPSRSKRMIAIPIFLKRVIMRKF